MDFDQTDHLISTILRKLAPRVGKKGVLTIFLAKLLFLIDCEYFRLKGTQATDFRYTWYKHGPYPPVAFEERLEKLEGYEIARLPMTRVVDGRPYALFYAGSQPRFEPHLEEPLNGIANRLIEIFKDADWEILLQYVYNLDIVKGLEFGMLIDFGGLPTMKTADEELLAAVATAFETELAQPLSKEHMNVIKDALREPTNENIEMARRMLNRQRIASKYS